MAAFVAITLIAAPADADDAKVARLQQQLQQARASEAAAKTKYAEAQKAWKDLYQIEYPKIAALKAELKAQRAITDTQSPEVVRARIEKITQLETQIAAAEKNWREKSDPLYKAREAARFAAAQATGEVNKIQGELTEAQAEVAAAAKTGPRPGDPVAQSPKPSDTKASAATADEVTVPNLAVFDGTTEMQAVARHAGLVPRLVATKATPPPNSTRLFADQKPKPGAKAKKGDPLQIIVYQKAAGTVDVPDFRGLTLEQATTRLPSNMTITSDEVGDKPPTPEQALTIFSQYPSPNTMFPPDKQVVVAVKRYGSAKTDASEPAETSDSETTTGAQPTNPEEALFGDKAKTKKKAATTKKKRALTAEEKKAISRAWFKKQRGY